jgi:CHAD domain-containing protein
VLNLLMKKLLHKTFLSLAPKIIKYAGAIMDSGYDQEVIHKLRTSFKKLRALLRWQKAGPKNLQDIKHIYAIAGQLRNIQVVQQLLSSENVNHQPFQNWVTITIGKIKKQWEETNFKESACKFQEKLQQLTWKPVKNKRFFSDRLIKIQSILLVDPVPDNLLHEIRKMIKDMYYVLAWWKSKVGNPGKLSKIISIEKLENMGKLIGEYNDKRMLLILLTTYTAHEKDARLISNINPLIDKWELIKRSEKEKLIAILRYEIMNK